MSRGGGDGRDWRHGQRGHGWIGDTVGEYIAEFGDDRELSVVDRGGCIFDCSGEEVERVYDAVAFTHSWLCEVFVEELDGVRVKKCLGGRINDVKAAVVVWRGANVEPATAAEVPRFLGAGFGVDDDRASNWSQGRGVKVEWAVQVFPSRHCWGECRLSEEVES